MSITYLVEILCYLDLHIIRNALILLDTLIKFIESLCILGIEQLSHHTKHTMNTLTETSDFLLSFKDRKLWSLHDTCLNKAQSEILIFLVCLRLDKLTNNLFQLWDKPNQHTRIANIETSVEHRQNNRKQFRFLDGRHTTIRIIPHNRANEIHKRIE